MQTIGTIDGMAVAVEQPFDCFASQFIAHATCSTTNETRDESIDENTALASEALLVLPAVPCPQPTRLVRHRLGAAIHFASKIYYFIHLRWASGTAQPKLFHY